MSRKREAKEEMRNLAYSDLRAELSSDCAECLSQNSEDLEVQEILVSSGQGKGATESGGMACLAVSASTVETIELAVQGAGTIDSELQHMPQELASSRQCTELSAVSSTANRNAEYLSQSQPQATRLKQVSTCEAFDDLQDFAMFNQNGKMHCDGVDQDKACQSTDAAHPS